MRDKRVSSKEATGRGKNLKVIFLDVDGVLNSEPYYMKHMEDLRKHPIDPDGVERLARIIRETEAKIVLSSSWRGGWDPDPEKRDIDGKILSAALEVYGLSIFDKTGRIEYGRRAKEIKAWIHQSAEKIESFVILDDCNYAWEAHGLKNRWVRTDFVDGGLLDEDVEKAIEILGKKITAAEWLMMKIRKGRKDGDIS